MAWGVIAAGAFAGGCRDEGAPPGGDSAGDGEIKVDTADTGGGGGPGPIGALPILGPGLHQGGAVACDAPEERESEGPMRPLDLGADWDAQPRGDGEALLSGLGLAVEDFDGDDRLDVFLPDRPGCQLFLQQADGTLRAAPENLLTPCGGSGAAPADADGDGDIDVFVSGIELPDQLLINRGGGVFADEALSRGIREPEPGAGMGASWGDLDGDGDLDLFVASHRFPGEQNPPDPATPNYLYENLGDGTFADISDRLTAEQRYGYTFLGGWIDPDLDGDVDLYIVNDFGGLVYGNFYLRNDGGTLVDASAESGLGLLIDGMGLGFGDVDGDGWPDLALSDWSALHLMMSDGAGGFYDAALARGVTIDDVTRVISWGLELADLDNDADLDLMALFGPSPDLSSVEGYSNNPPDQPDALWLQGEGGQFTQVAESWGLAHTENNRGLVLADYTGDGWLDVFKRQVIIGPTAAYAGRCGAEAWLRVRLEGNGPNTSAVGARIETWTGDQRQMRWIASGSTGLSSGGPLEAHFGLGDAETVDALDIYWPGGGVTRFTHVPTRQRLLVVEAEADVDIQ